MIRIGQGIDVHGSRPVMEYLVVFGSRDYRWSHRDEDIVLHFVMDACGAGTR